MQVSIKSFLIAAISGVILSACGGGSNNTEINEPPEEETGQQSEPTLAAKNLGQVFVTAQNLTLYTFEDDRNDVDGDGVGDSDCNAGCATSWPPLEATTTAVAAEPFSIITRDDGITRQWAVNGLPLYRFSGDSNASDVNGEGVGNSWFVARPAALKTANVDAEASGTVLVGQFSVLTTDGSGGVANSRIEKEGFTLYTFENDRNDIDSDGLGDSDCNGNCAEIWPPLFADNGATATGDFSIVERDDGARQWAYLGLPLYFYANDTAVGDTRGEGIGSVWFVARPTPVSVANSSLGDVLTSTTSVANVDENGSIDQASRGRANFSLYVFDNDRLDTDADGINDSDCNATCAATWPPLFADAGATPKENYSIITRDDGTFQWAFKGEPLYFFSGDTTPGDVNGDQLGGSWHLARIAPVQLFNSPGTGNIFAARGLINRVAQDGNQLNTTSDKTGFTVYLFDDDAADIEGDGANDSDCNGSCAVTWPPLYADPSDVAEGDFSIISREDGSLQWVYKGAPLYFFQGDASEQQTNGVYGTWHAVEP